MVPGKKCSATTKKARRWHSNNKQKPPFVPCSTKSGFLSFYCRSKEPCGSLFRQVLFVLQRVPDVLDCCALKPYKPLLIVWAQYTTFLNLSQVRYYFISTLSISAWFLSAIWVLSCNRLSHLFRSKRLRPCYFSTECHCSSQKCTSICIFISYR